MKKAWSLLPALALLIGLCACGGGNKETQAPTGTSEEEQTEATTAAETAPTETQPAETKPERTELERLKAIYDTVPVRYELDHYETDVKAIEARGVKTGKIVFYGPSTFTRWSRAYGNVPLEEAMIARDGSKVCLNHGFGGCTWHQLNANYERLVKPYAPKAVVFSGYGNDMGKGYNNHEILIMIEYLCERIRTDFPGIPMYLVDVPPKPNKTYTVSELERYRQLGQMVKEYCDAHEDCHFVAESMNPYYYTDPQYVGTYTHVRSDIFIEDNTHFNAEGYALRAAFWRGILYDLLEGDGSGAGIGKVPENLALASRGTTVTTDYALGQPGGFYLRDNGTVRCPVDRIIDGDSAADAATCCRLEWTKEGSIVFDLKKVYLLTGYGIYNYTWPYQWCINKAWTVYTSVDGTTWTKQRSDSIDCSSFTASVDYAKSVKRGEPDGGDFDAPVEARYVKLVVDEVFVGEGTTKNYTLEDTSCRDVRIYEFEIYGCEK